MGSPVAFPNDMKRSLCSYSMELHVLHVRFHEMISVRVARAKAWRTDLRI